MRKLVLAICAAALAFVPLSLAAASHPSARRLFRTHCSRCHGPQGKGKARIHTPNFTSPKWQASHSNERIISMITNGEKGTRMPAWKGRLTPVQIRSLMHYVRSLNSDRK